MRMGSQQQAVCHGPAGMSLQLRAADALLTVGHAAQCLLCTPQCGLCVNEQRFQPRNLCSRRGAACDHVA